MSAEIMDIVVTTEVFASSNKSHSYFGENITLREIFDTPFTNQYTRVLFICWYIVVCVICLVGKYIAHNFLICT